MKLLHKPLIYVLGAIMVAFSTSCERIEELLPNLGGDTDDKKPIGYVYALTNSVDNEVVVYEVAETGQLTLTGRYSTHGEGSGIARPDGPGVGADALSSQDALVLSEDDQFLFAVNAGNNTLTSFKVTNQGAGLEIMDVVASGGVFPVSIAVSDDLLYVLNEGANGNIDFRDDIVGDEMGSIQGFQINKSGKLFPIGGSNSPLDFGLTNRGTIDFSPDGSVLALTEIRANQVVHYLIDEGGRPSGPYIFPAPGNQLIGPFGAQFDRNGFFHVSIAGSIGSLDDPITDGRVISLYFDGAGGTEVIGDVPTNGSAACWFEPSADFKYGYVTNTITNDISGYAIADNGTLTPLTDNSIVAATGARTVALEMAAIPDYLFVLAPGPGAAEVGGELQVFRILDGGLLTRVDVADGLPREAQGLAAIGDPLP